MDQATSQKHFSWPGVLSALIPVVFSLLGIAGAYGATRYAQGEQSNKIATLEQQIRQMVTRDELKLYIDLTRDDLREIKENMRGLRSELGRSVR